VCKKECPVVSLQHDYISAHTLREAEAQLQILWEEYRGYACMYHRRAACNMQLYRAPILIVWVEALKEMLPRMMSSAEMVVHTDELMEFSKQRHMESFNKVMYVFHHNRTVYAPILCKLSRFLNSFHRMI
jgi:hypothetical protein